MSTQKLSGFVALSKQKGAALFTVMVILLLSLLLILASTRTSLFNEALTGNDSDYARALEAAQILLADAEADVRGQKVDGSDCGAGLIGCRTQASGFYFPEEINDFVDLRSNLLAVSSPTCTNGICLNLCASPNTGLCNLATPDAPANLNFWQTSSTLAAMTAKGATYGQYTGAAPGSTGNTILTANPAKAWYWVEVIKYSAKDIVDNDFGAPNDAKNYPYIYRITVVAKGNKPGTQAVLQTLISIRSTLSS